MTTTCRTGIILLIFQCVNLSSSSTYKVDDSKGLGRRFDGIGGLSGGGVGEFMLDKYWLLQKEGEKLSREGQNEINEALMEFIKCSQRFSQN